MLCEAGLAMVGVATWPWYFAKTERLKGERWGEGGGSEMETGTGGLGGRSFWIEPGHQWSSKMACHS